MIRAGGPWFPPDPARPGATLVPPGMNFTPIFEGERVALRLSSEERARLPERARPGTALGVVTDLDTGVRYFVRARDCGAACGCDAEIVVAADRD